MICFKSLLNEFIAIFKRISSFDSFVGKLIFIKMPFLWSYVLLYMHTQILIDVISIADSKITNSELNEI